MREPRVIPSSLEVGGSKSGLPEPGQLVAVQRHGTRLGCTIVNSQKSITLSAGGVLPGLSGDGGAGGCSEGCKGGGDK